MEGEGSAEGSFALSIAPSAVSPFFVLKPGMFFMPAQTALMLFSFSLLSSFLLYSSLTYFMQIFSSRCTCFISSWFLFLKALFFQFRRAFTSLVSQGLLFGKQLTVLTGTTVSIQKFISSVRHCVTPSMASPCYANSAFQSVV